MGLLDNHRLKPQMMADGGDNNIFVYLGGNQEVPAGVTHAVIDPSVKTVRRRAFFCRRQLVSVVFHDGVEIIEAGAFYKCESLSGRIKLLGVREIEDNPFQHCFALSDVEFGDRLQRIGICAFYHCDSLRSIKLPSVRTVQKGAFGHCTQLTDVGFGIDLETIFIGSFRNCPQLERIAIPLKDGLFPYDDTLGQWYDQFHECKNLTAVDIVGAEGLHKTISSLLIESWKDEMNEEINRINQELPDTPSREKTNAIRLWIRSVIDRMDHFKAEHNRMLKEHMVHLELAVWKATIYEKDDDSAQWEQINKRAKIDEKSTRKEKRITSGADIIIKNVLPFLKLQ